MNKKWATVLLAAVMALFSLSALAEITVTKKDLNLNPSLDRSVSNVLVLMQDGDVTNTMMIASISSKTGRSVMTRIDGDLIADVMEAGETALKDVYMLGGEKSRGFLVAATLNQMLGLNISTYIALDISVLPELVDAVGVLNMQYDEEEAAAMGTWVGINELRGEAVLDYVRLKLDSDSPARSRAYDALMQLLYQGLHSGDLMGMMGLGSQLLSSMDTNLNALNAVTMVSAVQGGTDRRELMLPMAEHILTESPLTADTEAMKAVLHDNVYE